MAGGSLPWPRDRVAALRARGAAAAEHRRRDAAVAVRRTARLGLQAGWVAGQACAALLCCAAIAACVVTAASWRAAPSGGAGGVHTFTLHFLVAPLAGGAVGSVAELLGAPLRDAGGDGCMLGDDAGSGAGGGGGSYSHPDCWLPPSSRQRGGGSHGGGGGWWAAQAVVDLVAPAPPPATPAWGGSRRGGGGDAPPPPPAPPAVTAGSDQWVAGAPYNDGGTGRPSLRRLLTPGQSYVVELALELQREEEGGGAGRLLSTAPHHAMALQLDLLTPTAAAAAAQQQQHSQQGGRAHDDGSSEGVLAQPALSASGGGGGSGGGPPGGAGRASPSRYTVLARCERSVVLPPRSWVHRTALRLLGLPRQLLGGAWPGARPAGGVDGDPALRHSVRVACFAGFTESAAHPATALRATLTTAGAGAGGSGDAAPPPLPAVVLAASVTLRARLTGLQAALARWPVTLALALTAALTACLATVACAGCVGLHWRLTRGRLGFGLPMPPVLLARCVDAALGPAPPEPPKRDADAVGATTPSGGGGGGGGGGGDGGGGHTPRSAASALDLLWRPRQRGAGEGVGAAWDAAPDGLRRRRAGGLREGVSRPHGPGDDDDGGGGGQFGGGLQGEPSRRALLRRAAAGSLQGVGGGGGEVAGGADSVGAGDAVSVAEDDGVGEGDSEGSGSGSELEFVLLQEGEGGRPRVPGAPWE